MFTGFKSPPTAVELTTFEITVSAPVSSSQRPSSFAFDVNDKTFLVKASSDYETPVASTSTAAGAPGGTVGTTDGNL